MIQKINLLLIIFANASALTVDSGVNIRQIPEYSEYLKQAAAVKQLQTQKPWVVTPPKAGSTSKAGVPTPKPLSRVRVSQQVGLIQTGPFPDFPSISLCKDSPAQDNFYGHVFCWGMMALYALLVVSLIIYQLRSILWIRDNIPRRNGRQTNIQSVGAHTAAEDEDISGMLSMRPIAPSYGLKVSSVTNHQPGPARV
jgi:hypothetical protein